MPCQSEKLRINIEMELQSHTVGITTMIGGQTDPLAEEQARWKRD